MNFTPPAGPNDGGASAHPPLALGSAQVPPPGVSSSAVTRGGGGFVESSLQQSEESSRKVVDGRWEVQKHKLGEGNYGKVYLGQDLQSGVSIAVKVTNMKALGRELQERLKKEIEILQQIDHPNIVKLYDQLQSEKYQLLMLEYMRGKDLAQHMRKGRPLPFRATLRIFAHLSEGLRELHRRSIIHRDLKPQNLLLTTTDLSTAVLKIADFGFARFLDGACGDVAKTVAGSPLYMAPEVLEAAVTTKRRGYDAGADLYSVGVILYQMVAGTPPYAAMTQVELLRKMQAARHDPLQHPSRTSRAPQEELAACRALVDRLLDPDPDRRCTSDEFFCSEWVRHCARHARAARRRAAAASDSDALASSDELRERGRRGWAEVRELADAAALVGALCHARPAPSPRPSPLHAPLDPSAADTPPPPPPQHPAASATAVCLYLKALRLAAAAWRTLHGRRAAIITTEGEARWRGAREEVERLFHACSRAATAQLQQLHPDAACDRADEILFHEARQVAISGSVQELLGSRDHAGELYRHAECMMRVVASPATTDSPAPAREVAERCVDMLQKRMRRTAPPSPGQLPGIGYQQPGIRCQA